MIVTTIDKYGEIVRRLVLIGCSRKELAQEAGISVSYLSAVLHGKKGFPTTDVRIEEALQRLERREATSGC